MALTRASIPVKFRFFCFPSGEFESSRSRGRLRPRPLRACAADAAERSLVRRALQSRLVPRTDGGRLSGRGGEGGGARLVDRKKKNAISRRKVLSIPECKEVFENVRSGKIKLRKAKGVNASSKSNKGKRSSKNFSVKKRKRGRKRRRRRNRRRKTGKKEKHEKARTN